MNSSPMMKAWASRDWAERLRRVIELVRPPRAGYNRSDPRVLVVTEYPAIHLTLRTGRGYSSLKAHPWWRRSCLDTLLLQDRGVFHSSCENYSFHLYTPSRSLW